MKPLPLACLAVAALVAAPRPLAAAEIAFSVATYNLENYVDAGTGPRPAKSAAARAAVRKSIRALGPDVLALEEMGGTNALLELRASLKSDGLEYPHWEHVSGFDSNIHVAVLSRFPIAARRPHTNEGFLLHGRRFPVSRGFAEVDIQGPAGYRFTLIAAHLKSRREVPEADQAELREQEALALRAIIDARLKADPALNLVVLGDFNDTRDSPSLKTLIGRGALALVDTRPAESDDAPRGPPGTARSRQVTWTYYYSREDTYSRIDYILLSPGMAREWLVRGTRVLRRPGWGVASDHRPIAARFLGEDR